MAAVLSQSWLRTASIGVVVVALAGCGHSGKPAATSATSTDKTTAGASWSPAPSAPPDPQTLLRAGSTAVAKVPDSTLIFIQSDTADAGTWKIRLATPDGNEQELKTGSDGITVLVGPTPRNDSDADKAKRRNLVQAARLDYQTAVNKVLAAVPNGSITELRLDDKDGTTLWDADVYDTYLVEHKVAINATSGDLVANKQP
ncbi:metallopeptidase [Mycobacterium sp.]|uniref:PepSY domain-containing protein n=1 Tax=Mycobacterium sp. TaxID=1785 RepID=UPI00127F9028|nr:metallopeptidase [Mycobacterium sp.]KAA8957645.1 MAG: metallopeptidase [Mycobacterium sp.]